MDIQHILPKSFIKNELHKDPEVGLAIAIPSNEHYLLSKQKVTMIDKSSVVKLELQRIFDYTNVPLDILNSIEIKLNENIN